MIVQRDLWFGWYSLSSGIAFGDSRGVFLTVFVLAGHKNI